MNYAAYNQFEKWAVVEVSDFDSKIVQEVLENIIQLETELHQKKVK